MCPAHLSSQIQCNLLEFERIKTSLKNERATTLCDLITWRNVLPIDDDVLIPIRSLLFMPETNCVN